MATWAKQPGQTTQQALAAANNSPVYQRSLQFATGQAQPKTSPYSTSTPYGQQQEGSGMIGTMGGSRSDPRWSNNGGSWASPTEAPNTTPSASKPAAMPSYQSGSGQQAPYSSYAPRNIANGGNPAQRDQAMSAWTMPKQDLLQWGQSTPNSQFYTQGADGQWQAPSAQQQMYNPVSGPSAEQAWGRNIALVDQINNTAAQQQVGTYLGDGAPPQGWGQTNYNPSQMISNANQMINSGWQGNPFAAVSQQSFPSAYEPAGLLAATPQQSPPRPSQRSQMVGGMVQSTGATGNGFGSGQGGPNPGAIGYMNPRSEFQAPQPLDSLGPRPVNPTDRKSWDAKAAAINRRQNGQAQNDRVRAAATDKDSYQQAVFDRDYDLNQASLERRGVTRDQYYDQRKLESQASDAWKNDTEFQKAWEDSQRSQMTPTMYASQQNETVKNGGRTKAGFMKQSDIDAQSQWLAERGITGVPDGSPRATLDGVYKQYAAGKGIDYAANYDAGNQGRFDMFQRANKNPGGVNDFVAAQQAEKNRRAQSQEDIIRQFQQQRGSDPRQMMGRQRNRPPVYI